MQFTVALFTGDVSHTSISDFETRLPSLLFDMKTSMVRFPWGAVVALLTRARPSNSPILSCWQRRRPLNGATCHRNGWDGEVPATS